MGILSEGASAHNLELLRPIMDRWKQLEKPREIFSWGKPNEGSEGLLETPYSGKSH